MIDAITQRKIIFAEIDIQNDFMNNDGALYVPGAESLKPTILKLNGLAQKNDYEIIATGDYHIKEDKEFKINGGPFPFHCMVDTYGANRINGLSEPNFMFNKHTYDIGNEEYFEKLFKVIFYEPTTLIMYGVATDYCVTAAVDSFNKAAKDNNLDLRIVIISDAIIGIDEKRSNMLLDKWNNASNIYVSTSDELIISLEDKD